MENDYVRFPRNLAEIQEFYRKRLIVADDQIEKVMSRFDSFDTNIYKPMRVELHTIEKIVERYGANGFIFITAWNPNTDIHTNEIATRNLLKDIRKSPYKYLPVYVGYKEWTQERLSAFGVSFIIFNCGRDYKSLERQRLLEFGTALSRKYTSGVRENDDGKIYFQSQNLTSIISATDKECYVNPSPCDRNEEMMRHYSGEVIVMRQIY